MLDSQSNISDENAAAVRRARDLGVRIVLATGRPPIGTRPYWDRLGCAPEDILITFNGALIQPAGSGFHLDMHILVPSDYQSIAAFALQQGLQFYAFDENSCLTPERHQTALWEGQINKINVVVTDFAQLDPAFPLMKVMACGKTTDLDQAMACLPPALSDRYSIVRSNPHLLEFLNPRASKGQAVATLGQLYGIDRQEIICIGDSGNDIDMLEYAGLGVAMGNATEDAKAAADFIAETNDRNGVADVIERFVF